MKYIPISSSYFSSFIPTQKNYIPVNFHFNSYNKEKISLKGMAEAEGSKSQNNNNVYPADSIGIL